MSVITLFLETGESLLTPLSMVFFAIMIPTGVVTVLFGRRLLSVARRYRYLPVYAWAEIISGICIASIFLFMLVLPLNVISTLALTLIFLTATQELRSAG